MEGKLIKNHYGFEYLLMDEKGETIATLESGKLSLKNCQAIENGYDLDELFESITIGPTDENGRWKLRAGFITGFQKALEILGDKKFSEEALWNMFYFGDSLKNQIKSGKIENKPMGEIFDDHIQSLQKTEWDVEIEMICPHPEDAYVCGMQYGCGFDGDGCNHPNQIPYLDKDGCLILKRK